MRNPIRLAGAGLLLVAAALSGCTSQRNTAPAAYEIESWQYGPHAGRKITTPHYEIYSTVTDPVQLETIPDLVERAYAHYRSLVPSPREPQARMQVYLFATRSQWARETRRRTGARAEVYLQIRNGGFSENGVSLIQFVAPAITGPLLAHEGFHQYLHHCVGPTVPAWINEGLAVMCEGQRWAGDGLREFDPWYNPQRRNQLAESLLRDRLFPLTELLSTHAGNVVHETSARVGTYYAQVWGLALFLREGAGGKYAAGFERLCGELANPDLAVRLRAEHILAESAAVSPGEALFRSFIADDLRQVEHEYVTFLRQRILNER